MKVIGGLLRRQKEKGKKGEKKCIRVIAGLSMIKVQ
jgi:hypothetical protein